MLTRVDGDGRGGAALSMRAVTGKPIKLMGTGEKIDAIEDFDPSRIAGRILGMGDVVGLVEKAIETVEIGKAEKIAAKMRKGAFDLDDLAEQLNQMQKLGGMGGVLGMLPGVGKIKKQLDTAKLDDAILKRQQAIIGSMTQRRAQEPEGAQRLAQEARGGGIGHLGAGHQQAREDAPADGRHDEVHGQEARAAWADVRWRSAARASRRSAVWRGAASWLAAAAAGRASWPWRRPAARSSRPPRHAPRLSRPARIEETMNFENHREGRDMSLKIRLARAGAKKRPYYRIVVADSKSPRDGRYIEKVGTYNPLLPRDSGERVKLVEDRIKHWMGVGAQPTDRVLRFLDKAGMAKRDARSNPNKAQPGKKRVEREEAKVAAAAEKAKAAAEAAARPPEPAPEAEQPTAE